MGGAAQGKLAYAAQVYGFDPAGLGDGGRLPPDEVLAAPVIYRLHLVVRRLLEEGRDPVPTVLAALDSRDGWIVLCDEIGCGVVPIDRTDRVWREETGRLCIALASRADKVERIFCGLPQTLKG